MIKTIKTSVINFWHTFKSGVWLKSPIFWALFMAYAIPLGFLLYVLYMNFLPFGYNKTFTIDVGSGNDTKISEFYLEPSKDLSERKTNGDGNTYRELNGTAYAVFKPNTVLKDAQVTVSVEGEGVSIIPPVIDFKPEDVKWDYSWDFTQSKKPEELGLTGNAFPFDGAMYFDGKSRLELPNSADKFEDGPFTVYVEWTPQDNQNNSQEIIGHYNWELLQNKDNVEFRVGRMEDPINGLVYKINYFFNEDKEFFNLKHSALAIYYPAKESSMNGYIDLFIDNNFAGRSYFGIEKISKKYGQKNITFGTSHGTQNMYNGSVNKTYIINKKINFDNNSLSFIFNNSTPEISISGYNGKLNKINIYVK